MSECVSQQLPAKQALFASSLLEKSFNKRTMASLVSANELNFNIWVNNKSF